MRRSTMPSTRFGSARPYSAISPMQTRLVSRSTVHTFMIGDCYYLYFIAGRDFQVRVARSRVSDHGARGSWWKYDNGLWDRPGLGGESSPIAPGVLALAWVSHSLPLGGYLGIAYFNDGFG